MNISGRCTLPLYILPLLSVTVSLRYCRSNLSNDRPQSHFPADSAESQVDGRVEIEIYASGGGKRQGNGGEREDAVMVLQVRQIPLARSVRPLNLTSSHTSPSHISRPSYPVVVSPRDFIFRAYS